MTVLETGNSPDECFSIHPTRMNLVVRKQACFRHLK